MNKPQKIKIPQNYEMGRVKNSTLPIPLHGKLRMRTPTGS